MNNVNCHTEFAEASDGIPSVAGSASIEITLYGDRRLPSQARKSIYPYKRCGLDIQRNHIQNRDIAIIDFFHSFLFQ